jgi:hypothetical protein
MDIVDQNPIVPDANEALRIDFMLHLHHQYRTLQQILLAPPHLPLTDMEQGRMSFPFQHADLIKIHAVNAFNILRFSLRGPNQGKWAKSSFCDLTCPFSGPNVVLQKHPEAGQLWWAIYKMLHYSMFSSDTMPMGISHENLKGSISTQDLISAESALEQIIEKMDVQLDLLDLAGVSNQVVVHFSYCFFHS